MSDFPCDDDENAPRRWSPLTISPTEYKAAATSHDFNTNSPAFKPGDQTHTTSASTSAAMPDTRPTIHTIKMPWNYPPYEDPIDGRYPLHFDKSAKRLDFQLTLANGEKESWSSPHVRQFVEKLRKVKSQMTPPVESSMELNTCITATALAFAPRGTEPEDTPPFFTVEVHESDAYRYDQIYWTYKDLIEAEFPRAEYPELYPTGEEVIVRLITPEVDVTY